MLRENNLEKVRVPLYNRSFFWVLLGLAIIAVFGGGNARTNKAASKPIQDNIVVEEIMNDIETSIEEYELYNEDTEIDNIKVEDTELEEDTKLEDLGLKDTEDMLK